MNKKTVTIILIFLHIIFYPLFSDVVLATTGGSTLFSDFRYSEKDGMVYYIFHDNSGGRSIQGVVRYDPVTQKRETILSHVFTMDEEDAMRKDYEAQKERIWNNLIELPRIDLLKNDIKIEAFVERREEIRDDWQLWRPVTFQVIMGQGSRKEIGGFELNGCEMIYERRQENFEINFDGFLIPDTNSILFLAHTEGHCFEMGYGLDEIFLIDGFEILDSRSLESINEARDAVWKSRQFCFSNFTCPTQGGIFLSVSNDIAIADEEPPVQGEIQPETIEEYHEPKEQQENLKIFILILISAVLILSLFLIYLYLKKRRKPKS